LKNLHLKISLDKFYNLFLKDDAPHSFDKYQNEYIHDRNVSITNWKSLGINTRQFVTDLIIPESRILSFSHLIKNPVGFGPSEAKTTRTQLLRRYEQCGLIIENKTIVEGVPAADAFFVDDYWRIEANGVDEVIVSVSFEICFTKRTMFRNVIEKSVLRETRDWLSSYSSMIHKTLADEIAPSVDDTNDNNYVVSLRAKTMSITGERGMMICIYSLASVSIICLIASTVILLLVYQAISNIREELITLRMRND
jgi:VAD1 Analog of StAR-related lipid transfer domain